MKLSQLYTVSAIILASLNIVSSNEILAEGCLSTKIGVCTISGGSVVGFLKKNEQGSSNPTAPGFNLKPNGGWFSVYKEEQRASIYAKYGECQNNQMCIQNVTVVYGTKFNASFFVLTDNVAKNTSFLEWNRPHGYKEEIKFDSAFVKLRSSHSIVEMTLGNETEIILQVQRFNPSIDIMITAPEALYGDSTQFACRASDETTLKYLTPEEYTAEVATDHGVTPAPSNRQCVATCKFTADKNIRPFTRQDGKFGSYADSRVGWFFLFNHTDVRVAVRQNLCINGNSKKLCADQVMVSIKDQNTIVYRDMSKGGNITMNPVIPEICSDSKCRFDFTTSTLPLQIIINKYNEDEPHMDVVIGVPFGTKWENRNGACGSVPNSNALIDVVQNSYIRRIQLTATGKTAEGMGGINNYKEQDSFRFNSPCSVKTDGSTDISKLLFFNQGKSSSDPNVVPKGDRCYLDLLTDLMKAPVLEGNTIKVDQTVIQQLA